MSKHEHFWRTIEVAGYGWMSVCENCDADQSAEHTQRCFDTAIFLDKPCICGAEKEWRQFLRKAGRLGA